MTAALIQVALLGVPDSLHADIRAWQRPPVGFTAVTLCVSAHTALSVHSGQWV